MLTLIETWLEPLLRTALGSDADLLLAPITAVPTQKARVNLFTSRLSRDLPPATDPEAAAGREPAWFNQVLTLPQDKAKPLDFTLPANALGQVAEVQAPSGRCYKPGDAFTVDGRVLRFYRDPGGAILVNLRGDRSRGYREKDPARIQLDLVCWASSPGTADALAARALAVVLGAMAERDVIDLTGADAPGLMLRLTKPVARLAALENSIQTIANSDWRRVQISLLITGELDLMLSLGQPDRDGIIQSLAVDLAAPQAAGGVRHQQMKVE